MNDRLPPNNIEAEEAFLGSAMIDPDLIMDVSSKLKPGDFYREQNGWIYDAMLKLHEDRQPIDIVTITDVLRKREQLEEMGGEAYIIGLINTVPTAINGESYAKIVKESSVRRKMISAAQTTANIAFLEDEDIEEQIARSEQVIMSIRDHSGDSEVKSARQSAADYLDYMDRAYNGVEIGFQTGYFEYDMFTGGLASPFLHVVAGRTGMGKSSWLLGMVENACIDRGKRVLLFSLEMTADQVIQRIVARRTGINVHKLRTGDLDEKEIARVHQVVGMLSESMLFIDETPDLTPGQARAKANRIAMRYGLDLVAYDHLHLMQSEKYSGNATKEVGEISRQCMYISKELDVPGVLLAQLNRGLEDRRDKRPILRDLRESGEIEQNAYSVTFLFREDYYEPVESRRKQIAEVIIPKNRDGPVGTVELLWNPKTASFCNIIRRSI